MNLFCGTLAVLVRRLALSLAFLIGPLLALLRGGPIASGLSCSAARADDAALGDGSHGLTAIPDSTPPVEAVCAAAVRVALAEPERARSFVTRARIAGWLPEIRFRVYRRFARTEGLSFNDMSSGTIAPVDISAIDDVRYEWRATWDLSRMVFNPDELQAHSQAMRMSDIRRDIQFLVIKLFFERRRMLQARDQGGTAAPPSNPATAPVAVDRAGDETRALRLVEIEAELDALSGGFFSAGTGSRPEVRAP